MNVEYDWTQNMVNMLCWTQKFGVSFKSRMRAGTLGQTGSRTHVHKYTLNKDYKVRSQSFFFFVE